MDECWIVGEIHNRPDPAAQQPFVTPGQFFSHVYPVYAQVDQIGPILILCFYQADLHLIYHPMVSALSHLCFKPLRLVRANVMLRQDALDLLEPCGYHVFIC